ncbi:MAG: hypothetical protein ACJ8AT_17835 [Hyalangium sp.]|uniref:hypothetical protein n=1 Tax=Hyalangium sp. TaxID=2028555 RepID=UPI003899EECF
MTESLRPVFHPQWGNVYPIRDNKQATHVWQHLYNPIEHWDELARVEIRPLFLAAKEKGCPDPPPTPAWGESRDSLPHVPKPCYALLKKHHDQYYGPAYLRELGSPKTLWGAKPESLLCCTPRGVLVAVKRAAPCMVRTAFRPDLPIHDSAGVDDDDYYQEAHHRWEKDMTSMSSSWKRGVLRELTEASRQPPQRTFEAWRLVRAIGHARPLAAKEPELAAPLLAAEALLARDESEITRLLQGRLRTDEILDGLRASLSAHDVDEARDRLLAVEDLLVVNEVLGLGAEIARIQERLQTILSPSSRTLVSFAPLAHARLPVSGQAGQALWNALLAGLSSALGPLAAAQRWLTAALAGIEERISRAGQEGAKALGELITNATLQPVGVLHGRAEREFEAQVEGHCRPDWQLRLFVVDAKHHMGEELLRDAGYTRSADRWRLEEWRLHGADDDTLVIAIAAPSLPTTKELERLLEETSQLPEAWIQGRWLMPSSERMP